MITAVQSSSHYLNMFLFNYFSEAYEGNADEEPSFMYYINDGVYGSFNCLLYDHAEVEPTLVDVSK